MLKIDNSVKTADIGTSPASPGQQSVNQMIMKIQQIQEQLQSLDQELRTMHSDMGQQPAQQPGSIPSVTPLPQGKQTLGPLTP